MLSRRIRLFTLALLIAGLVAAPDADAKDEVHKRWRDFSPSGTYVLVKDRETQKEAVILHSRRAAAFLILNSGYKDALLLEARTSTVSKVEAKQVKRRDDGGADLLEGAQVTSLGKFRRSRRDIQIRVDGFKADLKPNPPLLAWKLCDELVDHSPEYGKDAKSFPLDEEALEKLKAFKGVARVNVYFGSWCHTCSRYLGRIVRLELALADLNIDFHYYGLPRVPAMYRDAEVRRHRIRKLPSGVIYKDGRRVGLVASTRWNKPAIELAKLLVGSK